MFGIKKRILAPLVAVLLCWTLTDRSEAYCPNPGFVPFTAPIGLKIHGDIAANWRHADGTAWTSTELQYVVMRLIAIFNDYSGSGQPPLYYDGITTTTAREAGKVKILLKPVGVCGWSADGSGQPGGRVWVPRWDCNLAVPSDRELFTRNYGDAHAVISGGVMAHEIGHTLGLTHQAGCSNSCQSVLCQVAMQNMGTQMHSEMFVEDQRWFRATYGAYNSSQDHLESTGNVSWYSLPGSVVPAHQPTPGLSDAATGGPYMTMHSRYYNQDYNLKYRWVSGTMSWEYWYFDYNPGTGALGSAYDWTTGTGYFVQQSDVSSTDSNKTLQWAKQTGAGWPTYYSGTSVTERHGVDAAYDPSSGYIVATTRAEKATGLTDDWQILIHVIDPATNQEVTAFALGGGDPILAFDTPSITCGPGTITDNCMLAWAEAGDPTAGLGVKMHVMRTMQFRLARFLGWVFVYVQPPLTVGSGYVAFSRPSITYKGSAGSSSAFVLSWDGQYTGSAENYQWTMHKNTVPSSPWTGLKFHGSNGKSKQAPALGAQNGSVEFIRAWKP